jgi:hypothetical protein
VPRISHFFGEGTLAAELILSSRSFEYHRAWNFLAG